jgi:hypothetical protein
MTSAQSSGSGVSELTSNWADSGTADRFDTNSEFNTSTGRFTPTRAGYYQVNAYCSLGGIVANKVMEFYVRKNNTTVLGKSALVAATTETYTLTASALIYCNGSSDYISLAAYHNDTVNRDLTGAISIVEVM